MNIRGHGYYLVGGNNNMNSTTVEIPLGSRKHPGLYALIDVQDYDLVKDKKWHPAHMR